MEWLPPGCFLRYNHVSPQTNGLEYQILSYLSPVLRTWAGSIWFLQHKNNKLLSIYRNIKSQYDFTYNKVYKPTSSHHSILAKIRLTGWYKLYFTRTSMQPTYQTKRTKNMNKGQTTDEKLTLAPCLMCKIYIKNIILDTRYCLLSFFDYLCSIFTESMGLLAANLHLKRLHRQAKNIRPKANCQRMREIAATSRLL